MKIAITGGPKTGKTTMAEKMAKVYGVPVYHTDDLIHLGWSEASLEACKWFDQPSGWIIEGVAVSRALRKWRKLHPDQPCPANMVIYLWRPHEPLTPEQKTMAKGVETVHKQLKGWIKSGNFS